MMSTSKRYPKYTKVLDYCNSKDPTFMVEFRSNKRRSDGEWIHSHKLYPDESWSTIKRVELDAKTLRSLRENPDLEKGRLPDIYRATNEGNKFFIGMESSSSKCVVTDRNPQMECLFDIHRCIYLPSSFEKNQTLPTYLSQTILFMELPSPALFSPGLAPGMFFITPKLMGCNIFVAYDEGLHKFWVLRISGKDPHKPPDLEFRHDNQPRRSKSAESLKGSRKSPPSSTSQNESSSSKETEKEVENSNELKVNKSKKNLSNVTPTPYRRGGKQHFMYRTPISKRVPLKRSGSAGKLDKVVDKQKPQDWVNSHEGIDLLAQRRRYDRSGKSNPLDAFGAKQTGWRPSTPVRAAREREIEAGRKPKTYAQYFREYRGYAECVLDYLRIQGFNAKFCIRVATDRHWVTDVRDQKFWLDEINKKDQCKHFMYRGEAVFYGQYQDGTWIFGLKDLNTSLHKHGVFNKFPMEGTQLKFLYKDLQMENEGEVDGEKSSETLSKSNFKRNSLFQVKTTPSLLLSKSKKY